MITIDNLCGSVQRGLLFKPHSASSGEWGESDAVGRSTYAIPLVHYDPMVSSEHSDDHRRHDPLEGVDAAGMIVTGATRAAVPVLFEPLLTETIAAMPADVGLYIYGSVATGQAIPNLSDVDLLTVGLSRSDAAELSPQLTSEHLELCRAVEIGPAQLEDFVGAHDEAYGMRVFLRHYCVHLTGPSLPAGSPFPADARAARGFNGDIARHADRWMQELDGRDPAELARIVARKTLLAVAGLVSVHDSTWSTDRRTAATRWAAIDPTSAGGMSRLVEWSQTNPRVATVDVRAALLTTVARVVQEFETRIGLWTQS